MPRIGLRYRIGYQTQAMKSLPGVVDQESLRRQCRSSGLLLESVQVRDRLSDGQRLVILCRSFTRELMALPREPPGEAPKGRPEAAGEGAVR